MVDLDVIAPTDTAVNTMPITLVLGKNDKGETTIIAGVASMQGS
jgi:ABC-type branched-subunit amino acid transport system ATPase component